MTLSKHIRKIIGPAQRKKGNGKTWFQTDPKTKQERNELIAKLQHAFECWKMVRKFESYAVTDLHFIVATDNEFFGWAQIVEHSDSLYMEGTEKYPMVINFVEGFSVEQMHDYNRNYDNVLFYKKVEQTE